MKTVIQELITYFEQQKKQGCKNWCIEDLLAQLYQAKEMEKEQIEDAYMDGADDEHNKIYSIKSIKEYYNETFKSE